MKTIDEIEREACREYGARMERLRIAAELEAALAVVRRLLAEKGEQVGGA